MVQNRWPGRQVAGRLTVSNVDMINSSQGTSTAVRLNVQFTELNQFNNTPIGVPVFGTVTNSCDVYTIPIHVRKGTLGSSGATTQASMLWYHITDSAGLLFGSGGANLTGASGDSGVLVIPDSTAHYGAGRIITTSTGRATIILTSSGTSTYRPRVARINGLVTTGTPASFT